MSSDVRPVSAPDDRSCSVDRVSSASDSTNSLLFSYVPGIDVLRGIAILMVVMCHAIDGTAPYRGWTGFARWFAHATSYGWLGVQLFFVLSGFLITGILSDTRSDPQYYKNFYTRRCLRILPVYFLMLGILKLTGDVSWRFVLASVLFISNMPKLVGTTTEYGPFWSLAVEEQFYLVWPILVRKISNNALLRVVLAICVLCPLLRLVTAWYLPTRDTIYKTYMIADHLAYGALIAVGLRQQFIHARNVRRIATWALAIGIPLSSLVVWMRAATEHSRLGEAMLRATAVLPFIAVFVAMLLISLDHATRPAKRARSGLYAILPFVGYVSYGLYAVHQFVFFTYDRWVAGTWLGQIRTDFTALTIRMLICTFVAIGLAYFSRRFYEEHFLALKSVLTSRNLRAHTIDVPPPHASR